MLRAGWISTPEVEQLLSGLTLALLVTRYGTSPLNSAGRTILPFWKKKRVEEVCWWVTARRLVHLNPQNPPLQPYGSHLTSTRRPVVGKGKGKKRKGKEIGRQEARKEVGQKTQRDESTVSRATSRR